MDAPTSNSSGIASSRNWTSREGVEVAPDAGVRTSTAELFQAVTAPAQRSEHPQDSVTLTRLLESEKKVGLTMALDLGAAIAERVGAIHASGRVLGAFDASRVVCTRDGRVLLSKEPGLPLAPELKRGEPASAAADVYAVGSLVYQLLTGKTPAQASAAEEVSRLREVPAPSRFNDKVDAELDAVVLATLRVEPSERPASVMALQAALDGISEELQLIPEPEVIGALVVKLLAEPKAQPVPEPRPSPGAAVATSKLQAAFTKEAPLFPGRIAEPVKAEALTTNRFEPWLPASEAAPAPEPVPAGRASKTEPVLAVAAITAHTPMSREELAKTIPVVVELNTTVPMRAPKSSPVTPKPLPPSTSQAVRLAAAVQLVEEPASVVVAPSLETMTAVFADEAVAQKWLQSPGAKTFIDQNYEDDSAPEQLITPGFIAGASTAGVVMLFALVLAMLTPSGAAPQMNVVEEQPVRQRAVVRPVVVAPAPATKAVEKPAVVAKAQPAPAPVAKKKYAKAPAKSHASNRRGVAP
jgi:hypothetical protein